MLITTALGAFGNRWWLKHDVGTGKWTITRERSPGGQRRMMDFDTGAEASDYFTAFTTPVVAVTASHERVQT